MFWPVRDRSLVLLAVPLAAALAFGAPVVAAADEAGPAASSRPSSAADEAGDEPPPPPPVGEGTSPSPAPAPGSSVVLEPAGTAGPTEDPASIELTILSTTLPRAYWGRPYSAQLSASRTGGLLWSLTDGQLPPGLGLSAAGSVTGTPTRTGDFTASVGVLDSAAVQVTRTVRFVVTAAFDPVVSVVDAVHVRYSYRSGCPVKPSGLRLVTMNHWGYDGKPRRGEMVMRAGAVDDLRDVFAAAFADRFPIHRMNLVEKYKANDKHAMADDNTSAFNCRHVTGNPTRLSQHSYGNAIDINTRLNPYVTAAKVYPSGSKKYLDRSPLKTGMIGPRSVLAKAFGHERWKWGARWSRPDYQHFSSNGG